MFFVQLFEHSKKKEGAKLETVIKLEEEEEGARGEPGPEALGKKVNGSAAMKKGILSSDVDGAVSVDGEQKKKKKRKARKTGAMSVLIDTHGNKYVLAEPARKTISHRDWHLLNNLCLIITVAFLLGSVCQLLGIPSLFGYVLCGVIVGPPGFNSVQVNQVYCQVTSDRGPLCTRMCLYFCLFIRLGTFATHLCELY